MNGAERVFRAVFLDFVKCFFTKKIIMKDVVNENVIVENEGVSVEISDNSTQINIDRRLSKKDVNRLLGFIEILMADSSSEHIQVETQIGKSQNNGNFEKKLDKEYIRKVYRYITSLDKNSPNYRKKNIHADEGRPNDTTS